MKKVLSRLVMLAMMLCACAQEELPVPHQESAEGRVFEATFEDNATRTYIEEGNLLRWNAGDRISLFDANTLNRQYQFDGETGDNSGTFSVVNAPDGEGNELNANYAVYPYTSGAQVTESGVVTLTLSPEQNYAEDSFGLCANTMVAVTKDVDDTFLRFKNVCGYLKLQLYGDDVTVKSITLTGENNERLAGKTSITPVYGREPTIVMSDEAKSSITLNCGDGVKIGTTAEDATAFWIVVPPTEFEDGFTITVTNTLGMTFSKTTSNKIHIERNVIKPMAAFEVEIEKIPNNEIRYTASERARPYYDDEFGARIESNSYNPWTGVGTIKFKGDVTEIGHYAFYMCIELRSIYVPSTVTDFGMLALYGCRNLSKIYCLGVKPPASGDRMFKGTNSDLQIYVPMEAVDKYKKAWSDYAYCIVGCNF